ncbi:MAG: ribonuclease Z [Promethearchaeia archaeon]
MKIYFLGTNGWYSSALGNTTCSLIDSNSHYIILDAGDGLHKLDRYIIEKSKPIILFLTHTHLDHISGLHTLSKFRFEQGITIFCDKGTQNVLDTIIRHPYTSPFSHIPMDIDYFEFEEGHHSKQIDFTAKYLLHSDKCMGYRINIENKIIAYCTDTGVCDNLYSLAKNADLLISECSYKPGQEKWGWPHLKPEEIATVAKKSNVKQLYLTHFDASIFETKNDRRRARNKARTIFQSTYIAYDDSEVFV